MEDYKDKALHLCMWMCGDIVIKSFKNSTLPLSTFTHWKRD